MKKYYYSLILITSFLLVIRYGFSQSLKTPYPIIFVHGIVGDETTWTDNSNGLSINPTNGVWDIIDFLHSGSTPLESGGFLQISLDYSRNESQLNTNKENDVYIFNNPPTNKDLYIINFAVHAKDGTLFKDGENLSDVNENTISNSETIIDIDNPEFFNINDIVSIDQEIMKVIDIQGSELTVERGKCNTVPSVHSLKIRIIPTLIYPYFIIKTFPIQLYNLYKESNQAAIAKQGLGLKMAIDYVKSATGANKVILVGHSMGGLAIREYIRTYFLGRQDVAKIVTIGTPHYGSNLAVVYDEVIPTDIMGMDERSDAIRDLKSGGDDFFSGLIWGHLNTYLFGGDESNVPERFYSKDINCNGNIGDYIQGVNNFNISPFPPNVDRTWITSTIVKLGIELNSDGIVLKNSQYVYHEDTLMTHAGHTSIIGQLADSHIGESKDIYSLIRGLDEPADIEFAYHLIENSITKGFITYQKDLDPTDNDLFKINISNRSVLSISMLASSSTGINHTYILNSDLTVRKSTTDIYNIALIDTLDEGEYYIRVSGTATTNSYQYPYTLTTVTTELPPNSLTATPSAILEFFDVVVNEFRDKTVTLTNNGSTSITISSLEITGSNADQFSVLGLLSFDIPPSTSIDVTVRCTSSDTSSRNATLVITNTSLDAPIVTVPLHAFGVDSATKRLIVVPDITYNFGNENITQNRIKTFILKNTGSHPITATGLSLTGMNADSYSFINPPTTPFDIETGEVKQVTIKFLPTTIGVKTADFKIINNSDNASPEHSITLYGNGKNSIYNGNYNTIVGYEFWFDENYATKIYTNVNPQQVLTLNTSLSTAGLTTGLHKFHLRAKDNKGHWGSSITEVFYKMPILPAGTRKIAGYEYWFDNDYASKESVVVPPQQTFILDSAINANSISTGLHSYHIRYKDDGGQWSSVITEFFFKLNSNASVPNLISEYRYWYDMDDENIEAVILPTPVNPYQLIKSFNTCDLPLGNHLIHFQFRDLQGAWSSVVTDTFNIPAPPSKALISTNGSTTICQGNTVTLTTSSALSYLWNTGATTQSIEVSEEGDYYLTVHDLCGTELVSDTIHISVVQLPSPTITGPNTTIIGESGITYSTETSMSGYIWNVSSGGLITEGIGTNSITVLWNSGGDQTVSVSYTNEYGCSPDSPVTFSVNVGQNRTLILEVLLEGLYNGEGTMGKAQNSVGDQFPGSIADKVIVELHNSNPGSYSTIIYSSGLVDLSIMGNITIAVPAIHYGSYFITIKHRNSIETTTAFPVTFNGGTVSYDFTSSSSQVYGDNLKFAFGKYLIYGGDVNQDGIIDSSDMIPLDNSISTNTNGYLPEDLNGDGITNEEDMFIIENNSLTFVSKITP